MSLVSRSARPFAFLGSTCAAALLTASAAWAEAPCDPLAVPIPADCARANAAVTVEMPAASNTERVNTMPGGFDDVGFSISVDGETVAGAAAPEGVQRDRDLALAAAKVEVKFDGLDVRPMLNVSTIDLRAAYRAGEAVTFRASSNYPAWIARSEVRIIDPNRPGTQTVARIDIAPNGQAGWTMPATGDDFTYVLRVYDAEGRYDETAPLSLSRVGGAFASHQTVGGPVIAAGEGEDRTAVRKIPVSGGAVTAYGTGIAGQSVRVMGEVVPVDAAGAFVVQRILPSGKHMVEVATGAGPAFAREIDIPQSEWFYVAIADVTLGRRLQNQLESASGEYDPVYVDGRAAYYLKGKVKGRYLITSSLDTGEGPLRDMFARMDEKDPRRVLQRLEPDDYYPVYGDDSTAYDDTPTTGRFYVRVDRGASYALWGDFKADVTGAQFLQNNRALYGAKLRYQLPGVTAGGEPRATVTAYAATPDTLPQRDILRGTGGSAYFLSRQDINAGSETLVVEVRDPDTGRVISTRRLVEGQDYDIDYIQGVVILRAPLASLAAATGVVRTGPLGTEVVNLVAQYEYTPVAGSLQGASVGGRVEGWLGDNLRLGFTAMRETTGLADQNMAGADLRYSFGSASFIEAEVAGTNGPGFGRALSTDGGLTITSEGVSAPGSGRAYRFATEVSLADLGASATGVLGFYIEHKQAGFSTIAEDITEDQTLVGGYGTVDLTARTRLRFDAEDFRKKGGDRKGEASVDLSYQIDPVWSVQGGLAWTDKITAADPTETGSRVDAGLRLNYQPTQDLLLYVFGQTTLSRSGGLGRNGRLGLGTDAQLTEKLSFQGEISDGDLGTGAKAQLSYAPTVDNEVYLGYTLDPTRDGAGYELVGRDRGKLVMGARYRYSEAVSTYGENTYDLFGDRHSLTRAYGVSYTPDARWTVSGGMESGTVADPVNGDFDRDAYSLGVAYAEDQRLKARLRLEYRTENGTGTSRDRDTWLLGSGVEYKFSEDWRFLANADALISNSSEGAFRDGKYVEVSLGAAYRPIDNDRVNALFKYSYLYDLPGEDQVTASGSVDGPSQKSHVLSLDVNYNITPKLTFGGKYGYRMSQIAPRGTDAFVDSTAHLGILRADWHVVHMWDVLAEARMMYTEETALRERGALLGIYRHFGNNAKLGLGWYGSVSDDMTDLNYQSRGVFLNLIAKF